jgi:hypothetical protein
MVHLNFDGIRFTVNPRIDRKSCQKDTNRCRKTTEGGRSVVLACPCNTSVSFSLFHHKTILCESKTHYIITRISPVVSRREMIFIAKVLLYDVNVFRLVPFLYRLLLAFHSLALCLCLLLFPCMILVPCIIHHHKRD